MSGRPNWADHLHDTLYESPRPVGAMQGRGRLGRPYVDAQLLLSELLGYRDFIPALNQRVTVTQGQQGQPSSVTFPNLTFDENRNRVQRSMLLASRPLYAAFLADEYMHNPEFYGEVWDAAKIIRQIRTRNYLEGVYEQKWRNQTLDGARKRINDIGFKTRHMTLHPEEWIGRGYINNWFKYQRQYRELMGLPTSGVGGGQPPLPPQPPGGDEQPPAGGEGGGQNATRRIGHILEGLINAPRYLGNALAGENFQPYRIASA